MADAPPPPPPPFPAVVSPKDEAKVADVELQVPPGQARRTSIVTIVKAPVSRINMVSIQRHANTVKDLMKEEHNKTEFSVIIFLVGIVERYGSENSIHGEGKTFFLINNAETILEAIREQQKIDKELAEFSVKLIRSDIGALIIKSICQLGKEPTIVSPPAVKKSMFSCCGS
jgi:hypothetical protein